MNYSAQQIARYIDEEINLTPNSNWTIYDSPNGLNHTKSSMEYRDEDYEDVITFITMDEVPDAMQDLIDSVKFQLNK